MCLANSLPSPTSSTYSDTPPELIRSSNQSRRPGCGQHALSQRPKKIASASSRQSMYGCTFCTETFRTKQSWQQHEAAFHLPLQRWRCSRQEPYEIRKERSEGHRPQTRDGKSPEIQRRPSHSTLVNRDKPSTCSPRNAHSESPQNAYELIAIELMHYAQIHIEAYEKLPTPNEMKFEACRIILTSEMESDCDERHPSWLRDLILDSSSITARARSSPLRVTWENILPTLQCVGRKTLFDSCPLESQLHSFVWKNDLLSPLSDDVLQEEAARIIWQEESQAGISHNLVTSWLVGIIHTSTDWLSGFKERACQLRQVGMKS